MADGKSIGELIVEIGAEIVGGSELKDFIRTLGEGSMTAYAQAGALEQVSVRMRELAEVVMQAAASYEMFESTTGLSAEQLQAWQGAAHAANVSVETMTQSVQTLGQHLANVRFTGQGIKPFQIMGIDPRGDPFQVMQRMIQWSRGQHDKAFAGNLFEEAGMSRQLLQLGRLSDGELATFMKHAAVMTSAQQTTFNRLTLAITEMHQSLMKLGYALMEYVIPPVTHALNIFNALLDVFVKYKTEVAAFGVALAAGFLAMNPALLLMVAAFGSLFLILDDMAVYMEGGDSLIGRAAKALDRMPRALAGLKAFFESLKVWVEALVSPVNLLITLFEKAEAFAGRFMGNSFPMGRMPFPQGQGASSYNVNVNVHSAGPLDASGWGDVSYMMKKAVMDAAMQTHR